VHPNEISEKILGLIRGQSNLFVGAGVSMQPPCNLPSGMDLKNLIISHLSPPQERKFILRTIKNLESYNLIVPEIIFQRAYEVIGEKLLPFFDILKHAPSNNGHFILAKFIEKNNCKLFTTNFDELIEKYTAEKKSIVHLHGQLNNIANMIIRINQVGKGLNSYLQKQFKEDNARKSLIVLGYSGNDKDIIDIFNSTDFNSIFWVAKNANEERLRKNLSQIKNQKNLTVIEANLTELFNELQTRLNLKYEANDDIVTNFDQTIYLKEWSAEMTSSEKYSFIEKLFFDLDDYEHSLHFTKKAIQKKIFDDIRTKSWFFNEAAYTSRNMGNFISAMYFINQAIKHRDENYFVIANSFNIKGILLLESIPPKPNESLPFFKKAELNLKKFKPNIRIDYREEELIAFLSRIYNNIGLAYANIKNYSAAINYYQKSLRLKRKVGNLDGICITATNICLAYLYSSKKNNYYFWKKKIFFLLDKYGFSFSKAYFYRECGEYFCNQKKIKRGLEYLKIAEKIYLSLNNSHGLIITKTLMTRFKKTT
jgi:tetratricopeptide (TPR) repeat protein